MKSAVTEKNFVFLTISGRIKLIKFLKLSYNYERNFEMTPFTIVDDLKRKTRKYVIDLLPVKSFKKHLVFLVDSIKLLKVFSA